MNMEFLSCLYQAFSDESSHLKDGENLGELYQRISETDIADQILLAHLKAIEMGEDMRDALNDCLYVASQAYEQQGFINGFRLGLMLMRELGL